MAIYENFREYANRLKNTEDMNEQELNILKNDLEELSTSFLNALAYEVLGDGDTVVYVLGNELEEYIDERFLDTKEKRRYKENLKHDTSLFCVNFHADNFMKKLSRKATIEHLLGLEEGGK